jgi:hypothetical protein
MWTNNMTHGLPHKLEWAHGIFYGDGILGRKKLPFRQDNGVVAIH